MILATWNVNSVAARLERLIGFLRRVKPDVVCLQELKCIESAFPFEQVRAEGYECFVLGQKTYNGVAILSRVPATLYSKGFGDSEMDKNSRIITCVIDDQFLLSSVYIPNGQEVGADKYFYKLDWLDRLVDYATAQRQKMPLVLAGDFNIAPDWRDVHDESLWKGKILCSNAEREKLQTLKQNASLWDVFRTQHGDEKVFSWWDYRDLSFAFNRGLRIDYFLVDERLRDFCTESRIDRNERKGTKPSDHAPVLLSLKTQR